MGEGCFYHVVREGFSEKVLFQLKLQACKDQEKECSGEKNKDPDSEAGGSVVGSAARMGSAS